MNIGETTQALALAQAYDNRTVGEVNIRAWHAILGDLDWVDVMEAIREHYAVETTWIMPAHIRSRAGAMAQQRAAAAAATGWAPGQAGVPKDQAMPEVAATEGGKATIAALLAKVREDLPEGSILALRPRQAFWEREYAAYRRQQAAKPNPRYRPGVGA